jgi:hypothetical protein
MSRNNVTTNDTTTKYSKLIHLEGSTLRDCETTKKLLLLDFSVSALSVSGSYFYAAQQIVAMYCAFVMQTSYSNK